MALEILKRIKDACPRDYNIVKNTLATKVFGDTLKDVVFNNINYSFCAKPLKNGDIERENEIIVGFIVDVPTSFTVYSTNKGFTEKKSLKAGEFQSVIGDIPYPNLASAFCHCSISDLNGSGYIIFADIKSYEERHLVSNLNGSKIFIGDYCFLYGLIGKRELLDSKYY